MRKCCIEGCLSCNMHKERCLFEINDAKKEWENIIRQHQELKKTGKLYICDLHFNVDDIQRHKTKTTLRKNSVPHFNSCESNVTDIFHNILLDDDERDGYDTHSKTIPLKEYENLMEQQNKLQSIINLMVKKIKLQDLQLKNLQKELQKPRIDVSKLSTEQREVIDVLANGINKRDKYSENVRKFCMQQQYYSTCAYKSLRLFFNKNLPTIRTLQLWYSSIDGSPGVCVSALEILREKAESYKNQNDHQLHLTMLADEVSIRKELCYCPHRQLFMGLSTVMNSSEQNADTDDSHQPKLANNALVFMVVGYDFKLAVGYEFLNGLESKDRAALTLQVIASVERTGVRVTSLTTDNFIANISTFETLGVKFDQKKTYFMSPTYPDQRIYTILDPPHNLKLIRKYFSTNEIYHDNQLIDWSLLETLVEKQAVNNFNLCNKLTKLHMNWSQKPMNVQLAAQTISNSSADALEQLRKDGYEEFKNSQPTEKFLRFFNNAFDILNFAEKDETDNKYKLKLCADTANYIFEFGEKFKKYIEELELRTPKKSTPILQSRGKRGFAGFYFDMISLQGLYEDFVKNGPLDEIYTFQFSQDHLEQYFSLIRNSLGRNDNPNTIEFESAFKKLLVCHPVMTSVDQNTISNATGILTVPSNRKKNLKSSTPRMQHREFQFETELCYEYILLEEIGEMDEYEQHMNAYIASCVEERFMKTIKQYQYKCTSCADVLSADKINDELLAMKGENIKQPSSNTLKLVIFSNFVMKKIYAEFSEGNNSNSVCKAIYENLDINDLYINFSIAHDEQNELALLAHKQEFISALIKTYMEIKSKKYGKKLTDQQRGKLIRHYNKRAIIDSGQ